MDRTGSHVIAHHSTSVFLFGWTAPVLQRSFVQTLHIDRTDYLLCDNWNKAYSHTMEAACLRKLKREHSMWSLASRTRSNESRQPLKATDVHTAV